MSPTWPVRIVPPVLGGPEAAGLAATLAEPEAAGFGLPAAAAALASEVTGTLDVAEDGAGAELTAAVPPHAARRAAPAPESIMPSAARRVTDSSKRLRITALLYA